MNEDAIEVPSKANASHVTFDMHTLGIELTANRKHAGRWVNECILKLTPEVRRVVPSSAPEFEQCACRLVTGGEQALGIECGFLGVVRGPRMEGHQEAS